jgi:hypothetical protein
VRSASQGVARIPQPPFRSASQGPVAKRVVPAEIYRRHRTRAATTSITRAAHAGQTKRAEEAPSLGGLLGDGAHDVRVANVGDREDRRPEHLSASSAEGDVVAAVVVHRRLGKHRIVLDLRLAQRRAVARDEDELGCER